MAMAKKKPTRFLPRLAGRRMWVQAAFLLAWLDPLMLRMHGICSPVFHCHSCPLALFACPIGVLANFSAIHVFPFIALGVLAATGALLGAFICGWICPFGFLQDLVGKIPVRKFTLPAWVGHFRYIVLIGLVVAVPYWLGKDSPYFFCSLCPAGALEGAMPEIAKKAMAGEAYKWPSPLKLWILGTLLVSMLFVWRPWCTLLCPLGAFYSLCNAFSIFYVRVDQKKCNECNVCKSQCGFGAGPVQRASDLRCIGCLDCTTCGAVGISSVFERSTDSGKSTDQPPEPPLVTLSPPRSTDSEPDNE